MSEDGTSESQGNGSAAAEAYRRARARRQVGPTLWMDPAPALETDTLWRGLTRDGEIRFLVARVRQTAIEMSQRLGCSADAAAVLAEAAVALQLLRSTVNPDAQMQLVVQHDGALGRVVVDAWPDGGMRGHVANPSATGSALELVGAGTATFVRYSPQSGSYRSTLQLAGDGIEGLAMRYLLESEQILGLLQLTVRAGRGGLAVASGYLLQVMPEGSHDDLRRVVGNFDQLTALDVAQTADDPDGRIWATALMQGFRWDQCARQELTFHCRCSMDRVLATLTTLPRSDLSELIADGDAVETVCEFCKERYRVDTAQLAALLEAPS